MPILIRPMTTDDIVAAQAISDLAFAADPFHQSGIPATLTPAQREEYRLWRISLITMRMSKPGARYFAAVDVDGETQTLVGLAGFQAPLSPGTSDEGPRWPGKPDFLLHAAHRADMFKAMWTKVLGGRTDVWFLQTMSVHPEYQGRGIGRDLVKAGLEIVDEDGKECYVEATPAAAGLYVRSGFELLLTEPLLDGTYLLTALLRPISKMTSEAS